MQNIQTIIIFLFFFICLISCGTNNTKEKELELKERELTIREKEVNLKQNDADYSSVNTEKTNEFKQEPTKQIVTTENSTYSKTTVKCGEQTYFIGTLKLVQDNDIVLNSDRKSYFLYFEKPINMTNNNEFDDCGAENDIKYTTVFENDINLKPFTNKKVRIYGSLGPPPTMHYNTGTLLDAVKISLN